MMGHLLTLGGLRLIREGERRQMSSRKQNYDGLSMKCHHRHPTILASINERLVNILGLKTNTRPTLVLKLVYAAE
jgi:hypothetical protein